jgi:glycosyltransferase involved in cell wall biosynthesis
VRPGAGVFIRERMFRVAQELPIIVVSPVPWFPFQSFIRLWKPNYRPQPAKVEEQQGIKVFYPRFFSMPGFLRDLDGFFMALSCYFFLKKITKEFKFNLIDAHFAYPDGYAGFLLGKWCHVPLTITLRGTEVPLSKMSGRKKRMLLALAGADKVFAVANSLKQHMVNLGADGNKIEVVGNAVDTTKFYPLNKALVRKQLDIPESATVLVSVGGLVPRKGFHRVLQIMPGLLKKFPELLFVIVGGDSPEGGVRTQLEQQVQTLGLQKHVRFLGHVSSEDLKLSLSVADVFVLATANEGWANVFLEAMACGLPVITTDVGGNAEVVNHDGLGIIVPFGDESLLEKGLTEALLKKWDHNFILNYAQQNQWEKRVDVLVHNFNRILNG